VAGSRAMHHDDVTRISTPTATFLHCWSKLRVFVTHVTLRDA